MRDGKQKKAPVRSDLNSEKVSLWHMDTAVDDV